MKNPGDRNTFVQIFRDPPQSDFDTQPPDPLKIAEGWVHKRSMRPSETENARLMEARISSVLEIDYQHVMIPPDAYVIMDGQRMDVVACVDPDERHEGLLIYVTENA